MKLDRMKKEYVILLLSFLSMVCCNIKPQVIDAIPTSDPRYREQVFNQEHGIDEFGNVFGNTEIYFNENVAKLEMNIYWNNEDDVRVSLPANWELKFEKYLLLAEIDNQENNYFLVLRHKKKEVNLTLKNYLEVVYSSLKSDTVEILLNHESNKLILEDQIGYSLKGETRINLDTSYINAFYCEDDEYIYDISMKYNTQNNDNLNRGLFDLICSSIVIEDKHLLKSSRTIKKEVSIKY